MEQLDIVAAATCNRLMEVFGADISRIEELKRVEDGEKKIIYYFHWNNDMGPPGFLVKQEASGVIYYEHMSFMDMQIHTLTKMEDLVTEIKADAFVYKQIHGSACSGKQ